MIVRKANIAGVLSLREVEEASAKEAIAVLKDLDPTEATLLVTGLIAEGGLALWALINREDLTRTTELMTLTPSLRSISQTSTAEPASSKLEKLSRNTVLSSL